MRHIFNNPWFTTASIQLENTASGDFRFTDVFGLTGGECVNQATAHAAHFFLQVAVIIIACRLCGFILKRFGQPAVIGEMVAGVLLGPSLFGALMPEAAGQLFPQENRDVLFALGQLGLTLYMFVVGLEFQTGLLKANFRSASLVSLAGILAPFSLGCLLAVWLFRFEGFFTPSMTPWFSALFLGAALSITAFPMLARIIVERGMAGTKAGTVALSAGSLDDVVAWILLAAVVGSISGNPSLFVLAIGGGAIYVLVCFKALKPLFIWAQKTFTDRTVLGIAVLVLVIAAWFTDTIGLYSVFGAFVLGLVIPRPGLSEKLSAQVGPITTILLLPMFFTFSGLNTKIGLVDSPFLWLVTAIVILAAVGGKLAACYFAARLAGMHHRDGLTVASLMNARGLMELILLNIALHSGLISQTLFTILVIMTIVTTLMAAPLFNHAARKGVKA
jgi:Kef-type K+ transport system membrane component KefB